MALAAKKPPNIKGVWIGGLTPNGEPSILADMHVKSQKKNGSFSGQFSTTSVSADIQGKVSKKGKITGDFTATLDGVKVRFTVSMQVKMDDGARVADGIFQMFDEHGGLLKKGIAFLGWVPPDD